MFKKMIFACGVLAVSLCGIGSVNAEVYDDADFTNLITNKTPITADDTLTVGGDTYIGADGAFTINDGSVTFSVDNVSKRILMTVDGNVSLNEGEKFFIKIPDLLENNATQLGISGFSLDIKEGSNFNIDGTVIIPNAGEGKVINAGTVNVNGVVELRSEGNYTSTGLTNVNGKFVIYGVDGTNVGTGTKFTINDNGAVYSDFDFSADMFVSGVSGKVVIPATVKDYDSVTDIVVTAAGNNTFAYGYELGNEKIEETVPEVDKDNSNAGNATEQNKPENVVNPKTGDINLLAILSLVGVSVVGLRVISKKIALKIN